MITDHPLYPFFIRMMEEYDRGLAKYGPWSDINETLQCAAVYDEYHEWLDACHARDIHGPHGELAELPQLAAVAGKRWEELTMRGNDGR